MLKKCVPLLGLFRCVDKKTVGYGDASRAISFDDLSIRLEDITVRIMHAGGREEQYQTAIPASKLMEKYPGMCVARPGVFKNPHESLLLAEDKLLPGHKYYIIPSTTIQKIKRKHLEKAKLKELGGDCSEESICSAKELYLSEESWSRWKKSRRGKKLFAPPIQKPRMLKGMGWEPSLTSVQELSP